MAQGESRHEERGGRSRFNGEDGEEGAQRGRRRRRRRGRGGGSQGAEQMPLGAEQPSDEGLAFMAAIEGAPAPREPRAERVGRGRGPGRWRRSAPLPDEFRDPSATFPADEGIQDSEGIVSPREAHMPSFASEAVIVEAAPSEPLEVEPMEAAAPPLGATVEAHKVETPPVAPPETEAAPAAPAAVVAVGTVPEPQPTAPPREPTEVVVTEADPNRPRKGGWWQRVRTPFGE